MEILNIAYWPIYGEMGILDTIKGDSCVEQNDEKCLESVTRASSFILLMIYMIVANILLINLLIAMFRY